MLCMTALLLSLGGDGGEPPWVKDMSEWLDDDARRLRNCLIDGIRNPQSGIRFHDPCIDGVGRRA